MYVKFYILNSNPFLSQYLSSVRLDNEPDVDEDLSEQSTKLLSDVSVSSDSILRPTRSIVAGSRKLFDQLELEEQALEREFASFRNTNLPEYVATLSLSEAAVPPEPQPGVSFKSQQIVLPESRTVPNIVPNIAPNIAPNISASYSSVNRDNVASSKPTKIPEQAATKHVLSEEENPSQSTITPSAGVVATETAGDGKNTDIMENLDPVMQQYLNRVLQAKETDKAGTAADQSPAVKRQDDTENIEHVEFDKTDSDFSW